MRRRSRTTYTPAPEGSSTRTRSGCALKGRSSALDSIMQGAAPSRRSRSNMGVGEGEGPKFEAARLPRSRSFTERIAGQRAQIRRGPASRSRSFKLREGMAVGGARDIARRADVRVSLDRTRLDRAAPDPRLPWSQPALARRAAATSRSAIREQLIFPEINYDDNPAGPRARR